LKEPLPSDWDWVTARRECSIETFYERLLAGARKNVQTRKEMRIDLRDEGPIDLSSSVPGIFSVIRSVSHGKHVVVRFTLERDRIVIEGSGVTVKFEGRVMLNDKGECRLSVDGQELDDWQVLRRALEPVFFGL
jgi:hypothetical protein